MITNNFIVEKISIREILLSKYQITLIIYILYLELDNITSFFLWLIDSIIKLHNLEFTDILNNEKRLNSISGLYSIITKIFTKMISKRKEINDINIILQDLQSFQLISENDLNLFINHDEYNNKHFLEVVKLHTLKNT